MRLMMQKYSTTKSMRRFDGPHVIHDCKMWLLLSGSVSYLGSRTQHTKITQENINSSLILSISYYK